MPANYHDRGHGPLLQIPTAVFRFIRHSISIHQMSQPFSGASNSCLFALRTLYRQPHAECGATTGFAFHFDTPMMFFDDTERKR